MSPRVDGRVGHYPRIVGGTGCTKSSRKKTFPASGYSRLGVEKDEALCRRKSKKRGRTRRGTRKAIGSFKRSTASTLTISKRDSVRDNEKKRAKGKRMVRGTSDSMAGEGGSTISKRQVRAQNGSDPRNGPTGPMEEKKPRKTNLPEKEKDRSCGRKRRHQKRRSGVREGRAATRKMSTAKVTARATASQTRIRGPLIPERVQEIGGDKKQKR